MDNRVTLDPVSQRFIDIGKPNDKLIDWERGWFSCAIDTDGCIFLHRNKSRSSIGYSYSPRLSLSTINREFAERMKSTLNYGSVSSPPPSKHRFNNAKPMWRYTLCSDGLRILLPQLHLIIKEEQRLLLIEVLGYLSKRAANRSQEFQDRLDKIYERFGELNNKSPRKSNQGNNK